jgi:hypothetical protein
MIGAPSTTCAPLCHRNLRHDTGKRRAQRVFHLHRLDYRKALTAADAIADADEKFQHLAVHRRLDDAIAGAGFRGCRRTKSLMRTRVWRPWRKT